MLKLILPALSYPYDALEPVISKRIIELHHDKHHAAYVNGANTALEKMEKIRKGEAEGDLKALMRDASFNYNGAKLHEIFWENMRAPSEVNKPEGEILNRIENNFRDFEVLKKEFSGAALSVEGSGWAVLWKDEENNLVVGQLEKHNLLGLNGMKPILVLDVWEHAYYLQYENDRKTYVESWWKVVNWEDVNSRI